MACQNRFRPDYEDYKRNWQEAIGKVSGIRIDLGQLGLERPDQGTPTQAALLEETADGGSRLRFR